MTIPDEAQSDGGVPGVPGVAGRRAPRRDPGGETAAPPTWVRVSWERRQGVISALAVAGIAAHLALRLAFHASPAWRDWPLLAVLIGGGTPLVLELAAKLVRRQFGSDLLAGISIITSVLLGEYLAGSLVVLMLAGGEALEAYAVRSASSVLAALARRMPSVAHRDNGGQLIDIPLAHIAPGDTVVIFPHEICPVDGTVIK